MVLRRARFSVGFVWFSLGGLWLLAGCGDDDDSATEGCDVVIRPSDDDRQAIQSVLSEPPGEVICLDGEFELADTLTLPGSSIAPNGVTLRGLGEGAVLDFTAQRASGSGSNGISGTRMPRVTIENLTVRNTAGDGIRIALSERVVFRKVRTIWDGTPRQENGAYGIYPVECTQVLVEDCEAYGASDAGIYAGQSRQIIVRRNRVHGNVAGIEIENCTGADVYENDVTDNTAGILVFDLPGLPAGPGAQTRVFDNVVYANNRPNFATPGTIVSFVPHGVGMMVLATRQCEMFDNEIRDNQNTGLLMLSFDLVAALNADVTPDDPDYNAYPSGIHVHGNTFTDNGDEPAGMLAGVISSRPAEAVIWDGWVNPAETGLSPSDVLCLENNEGATFRNMAVEIPLSFGTASLDASPHACSMPSLQPIELDL